MSTLREVLKARANSGPGIITHTELQEILATHPDHRTVSTLEELKTVYEGAILKDAEGEMWGIDGATGRLFLVGDGNYDLYDDTEIHLPATVVYEAAEQQP